LTAGTILDDEDTIEAQALSTSLDPYGQLVKMLMPRASCIAIYDRTSTPLWLLKMDWNITDSHILEFTAFSDKIETDSDVYANRPGVIERLNLIGTAGSLSTYFLLPEMGRIFDNAKIEAAGGEAAFAALSGDPLNAVLAQASTASFRIVAFMPAILLIVFGLVWLNDRRKGGFKPERL